MPPVQQYLDGLREKIEAEARALVIEQGHNPDEDFGALDAAIEGITDEYGQGFCDDADARRYGDYPYDGSLDQGDHYPEPLEY